MITKTELIEILRESPLYFWMDDLDLKIIVNSLNEYVSIQESDIPG